MTTPLRFGYVDGRHGQIHYRAQGAGPPVLLLHWAPSNGRQYEFIQPALAAHGFRVLALDLPGYGRSHKNSARLDLRTDGGRTRGGLRRAGDRARFRGRRASLCGGDRGTSILQPERWPKIVLDGSPTLTPEQMATLMSHFAGLTPVFTDSGGHNPSPGT